MNSEVIIDTSMTVLKNPSIDPKTGFVEPLEGNRRELIEYLDSRCDREGCHDNTAIHKDFDVDKKSAMRQQSHGLLIAICLK